MQVGDILRKKTARVATVRMNETVGIAAQLMRASNISALVVKDVVRTEGNTAVGMFTERDVLAKFALSGRNPEQTPVREMMSPMVEMGTVATTPSEALEVMIDRHYRQEERPFRCCQPRDLLLQIRNYCVYNELPLKMTPEYFDFAAGNYFTVL